MMKRSIQQVDIALVSIYAPHIGIAKYIMQILIDIKEETDTFTIIREFNTTLTSMNRSYR